MSQTGTSRCADASRLGRSIGGPDPWTPALPGLRGVGRSERNPGQVPALQPGLHDGPLPKQEEATETPAHSVKVPVSSSKTDGFRQLDAPVATSYLPR